MKDKIGMFFIVFVTILAGCRNRGTSIEIKKGNLNGASQIDTIEKNNKYGTILLGITINRPFGKFQYHYAIVKTHSDLVFYLKDQNLWPRVSNKYIALTKAYPDSQWGWFYLKGGRIQDTLPGINRILDSLKSIEGERFFIQEGNGDIRYYSKGRVVKRMNYGNLITKTAFNFDSLDYNLYEWGSGNLKAISDNGNDLLNQKDGLFFVPAPGFGVVKKFDKSEILRIVDSIVYSGDCFTPIPGDCFTPVCRFKRA